MAEVRGRLGLSQEALAEWLDVDVRTVQRWEAGQCPVFVGWFFWLVAAVACG